MSEKKLLALISLLMALIGGILVLVKVFNTQSTIDVDFLGRHVTELILGIGAIVFGIYMFRGHTHTGGLLTIVMGVLIAVDQGIGLAAGLVIMGGTLGIVTSG